MLGENRELTDGLEKSNESLKVMNAERERVLEVIAQNLRQPVIDQMNWCELLLTDTEHSLHREHIETLAKVNSAADGMLAQIQELLDSEKLEEHCKNLVDSNPPVEEDAPPAAAVPDEPSSLAEEEDVAPMGAGPMLAARVDFKVLVVEDDPILRDVLVGVLQRKFHVVSAADGWQALNLLVERPHLILTELDLPCVDTAELLRHANEMIENICVIAIHNAEDAARLVALSPLGLRDTIAKPFRIEDLLDKVKTLAETAAPQMSESVLLIGPQSDEHDALHGLLASRYRTCTAPSAEAALAEKAADVNLVIMDATDTSQAWETEVTSLREHNDEIKVLVLANRADDAVASAINEVEINAAVTKPYAFDDLLLRVRGLLDVKEIDGRVLRSVFRRPML
jgi:DNA-binding response OmpR family regulator